jgi:hypothetical protein
LMELQGCFARCFLVYHCEPTTLQTTRLFVKADSESKSPHSHCWVPSHRIISPRFPFTPVVYGIL